MHRKRSSRARISAPQPEPLPGRNRYLKERHVIQICQSEHRRALVSVSLRNAMEADAEHVASLLAELGYPSNEADIRDRLRHWLHSQTSCFLLAQSASKVIGLISAELVPYFPNGSTICRVTALVVSMNHRGRRVGERLVAGAADFARKHHCSGIEITSAEHRRDAHRFYERVGFSRTSFRFFRAL